MEYHTMSTIDLLNRLKEAMFLGEQSIINIIAYEIVCRLYVPYNDKITFEEMLESYGYQKIEKKEKSKFGR